MAMHILSDLQAVKSHPHLPFRAGLLLPLFAALRKGLASDSQHEVPPAHEKQVLIGDIARLTPAMEALHMVCE